MYHVWAWCGLVILWLLIQSSSGSIDGQLNAEPSDAVEISAPPIIQGQSQDQRQGQSRSQSSRLTTVRLRTAGLTTARLAAHRLHWERVEREEEQKRMELERQKREAERICRIETMSARPSRAGIRELRADGALLDQYLQQRSLKTLLRTKCGKKVVEAWRLQHGMGAHDLTLLQAQQDHGVQHFRTSLLDKHRAETADDNDDDDPRRGSDHRVVVALHRLRNRVPVQLGGEYQILTRPHLDVAERLAGSPA